MPDSNSKKTEKMKQSKKWSIAIFSLTIFWAFFIQSVIDAQFNSETVQANILQDKSTAREAFKISNLYKVSNIATNNNYLAAGEKEKDVYSFAIRTFAENLVLSELKIRLIGDINPEDIKKLQLFESDNSIASTYTLVDDSFIFKNFTSVLQANSYKEYVIKIDLSDKVNSGSRFKLEISGPYDVMIKKDNIPVHELDTYPLSGSYTTVLGWRK